MFAWLVRYFEPLYWVAVILVLRAVVLLFRRRLMAINWRKRLAVLLLPAITIAAVWLLVFLRVDPVIGKPGEVIRLDGNGQPKIGPDGKYLKVEGDPKDPGFYRVNLEDGYFLLQMPEGYDDDNELLAFACHFIGSHETDAIGMAIHGFRMTELANKHRFVNFYPISPVAYTLLGEPHHAWYSPLGTLSPRYGCPRDDGKFAKHAYQWMRQHVRVNPKRFTLHGFSDGALLALVLAQTQTDEMPIECLILAGGTILKWQLQRPLQGPGPRIVVIQLNENDAEILPIDTADGEVVTGGFWYWLARNVIGLTNLDDSIPRRQVDYWTMVLCGRAGITWPPSLSEVGTFFTGRRTVFSAQTPKRELQVIVYVVPQGHALAGQPGAEAQGEQPDKNFPWPEIVADFIRDSAVRTDK